MCSVALMKKNFLRSLYALLGIAAIASIPPPASTSALLAVLYLFEIAAVTGLIMKITAPTLRRRVLMACPAVLILARILPIVGAVLAPVVLCALVGSIMLLIVCATAALMEFDRSFG